jgi:hypothetical protein
MRDTQRKGDIAVSQAIASFTKLGWDISVPLTESAAYDLVVEYKDTLKRVQVRYTSTSEVDLRRIHSNSTGYIVKKPAKTLTTGSTFLTYTARSSLSPDVLAAEDQ